MSKIVLFGTRSPLLPDYEFVCARAGRDLCASIQVDDLRPRLLDRSTIVDVDEIDENIRKLSFIACAFSPKRRQELVTMAMAARLSAAESLVDPSAILPSSCRIGNGSFVNVGVVSGAAGLIGEHVFVNRSTNLGHHMHIENFASIGPGVTMAGNVHVGLGAYIGAGSVVLPGIRIGDGAVVAAGSVVRQDVPDGVLVAGNPAVVKREKLSPDVYGSVGEE